MHELPIDRSLSEIVRLVKERRNVVVVATPGAGKTTRVPPAILEAGTLSDDHPNLVMLQPRRVAARASAARIAEEHGWELGNEVGYHVRFDKKVGSRTRLRVLTEGILNRQMVEDPFLTGIGAVVLDEFHERSVHTDIAIALLREIQQTVREDLILIVMSATLEAEPVANFLGSCPIVRVEGRMFPVEISYQANPGGMKLVDQAVAAVRDWVEQKQAVDGDVLVFLPGAEEIRRTLRLLEPLAERHQLHLLPLYGSLTAEEQMVALRPSNRRKIICATNIAETSLTIDGVTTVIDGGYARVASFDPQRGLDRLEVARISQASATQRAGRAGRTRPGKCIRLWAEREHRFLRSFEIPEIHRVDLASTVLSLHGWGQIDARKFGWYESPGESALIAAETLLAMLGALSSETNGRMTDLGKQMMALPVHPRLARLLLGAAESGQLAAGAAVAALLSEKDILRPPRAAEGGPPQPSYHGRSDLLLRLQWLSEAEQPCFASSLGNDQLDLNAARQVCKTRDELLRLSRRLTERRGPSAVDEEDAILKLPLLAYPDRLCRRRSSDPTRAAMVGGSGVRIGTESSVATAEYFVALDARYDERSQSREALVRIVSEIKPEWLQEIFPHQIQREKHVAYDEDRKRVVGVTTVKFRDLVLQEDRSAAVDLEEAARALAQAVRSRAAALFEADDSARSLLLRVALLRRHMPEHPWPAFNELELGDILAETTHGKRTLDDIIRQPLANLLISRLHYPLDRLLDQHAPESIEVPTGNRIHLNYGTNGSPVLAVRLQEMFGQLDTPRIASGRVPVLLHLLGPNYRPVQITDDLRSFWSTTYFQVRKDLRVRYPKHSWPDDPLTAPPQAKGRSRK